MDSYTAPVCWHHDTMNVVLCAVATSVGVMPSLSCKMIFARMI